MQSKFNHPNCAIALVCLALLAGIWAIVLERIHYERADAIDHVVKRNSNLAVAFEEHTVRTLAGIDQAVRFIKHEYVERGAKLDIQKMIDVASIDPGVVSAVGVASEHGVLDGRTVAVLRIGAFSPAKVDDRDYFRFHRDHDVGELRIGSPILGRISGQPAIHMTRRINKPDGTFGGVAILAVDPAYFSDVYRHIDLGRDGAIQLVGLDGVVRARRIGNSSSFGHHMTGSPLFHELAKSDVGSYVARGQIDGTQRYVSYRRVAGYPLVVGIGTSVDEALAEFHTRQRNYYFGALLATVFVLLCAGGLVVAVSWRKGAMLEKERSEARYRATFDQAPIGIAHVALSGRFVKVNRSLCAMLGYTAGELLARSFPQVTHPDDVKLGAHAKQKLILDHEIESIPDIEKRLIRKDGGVIWVLAAIAAVRDSDGKPDYLVSMVRDITQRKRAEAALRESEQQFNQLAHHIPQILWINDAIRKEVLYISPAYEAVCGRSFSSPQKAWGEWKDMIHIEDRARAFESYRSMPDGRVDVEHRIVRPDGIVRWVHARGFPVRDSDGNVYRFAGVIEDVTDRKLMQEPLQRQAHYDSVTGLPNRTLCFDRFAQALNQAKRRESKVAVLSVDLDRFKAVNDTLGHASGDVLLRETANRLTQCVRAGDTVARLGGDEFIVILPDLAKAEEAYIVAQRIIGALSAPSVIDRREILVTASIGIATFPGDGEDGETLLKHADAAMLQAKQLGKNNVQLYTASMKERAIDKLGLENDLRRALERDEFRLHFQPKASLKTGRITGVEALLRWERPGKGLVPPSDFIPMLEETGLIVEVGTWVLQAACAQAGAWRDAGYSPVPVAVNLSAKQFLRHDLGAEIRRALKAHGVEPSLLEVELTESELMGNPEEIARVLSELRAYQVRVAVDDFGTGYSSLSYLKRFPLDALKLDRSFVKGLPNNPDDASIAKAVIGMAHSLGLKVVAEGVETDDQRLFLAANGCDEMQGYLLSRPVPASECQNFLRPHDSVGCVSGGTVAEVDRS